MGSHRNYQHAEIPHPHPGPPLEGEGDFAWLNNVANQEGDCFFLCTDVLNSALRANRTVAIAPNMAAI